MDRTRIVIRSALAALLAAAAASPATAQEKSTENKEKCYGIAKAGQNDCGTAKHSCAGLSKRDKDPTDWKYVEKGSCQKAGGSTAPGEKAGGRK